MKRFTETAKWRDPWFYQLSTPAKMLWLYVCDNCDAGGVIELYLELASRDIGVTIKQSHLTELESRLLQLNGGKWWVKRFIRFQYGKLSRDCKPHAPVFASLEKHQIDYEAVEQNERFTNIVSTELRRKIIRRDDSTCVYTGRRLYDWEIWIDHIVPRSAGGTTDLRNLVVMDQKLNVLKATLSVEEFCLKANLDYERIRESLSKATSKGSESLQDKTRQEEDKISTERSAEENHPEPAALEPSPFERFWTAYPRRIAKADAEKAFRKQKAAEFLAEIITAIEHQKTSWDWVKDGGQFIPHPATWLNQHRWKDEVKTGSCPPTGKPSVNHVLNDMDRMMEGLR